MEKECSRCGEVKQSTDFGPDPTCRDGLRSRCKACRAEQNRAWRAKNAEQVTEQMARYRRENRERIAEVQARRRAADQATVLRHSADRRARLRGAFVESVHREDVWARNQGICQLCDKPADPSDWHLDHIVPLARGGTHQLQNVQVSHPACNQAKGTKTSTDAMSVA